MEGKGEQASRREPQCTPPMHYDLIMNREAPEREARGMIRHEMPQRTYVHGSTLHFLYGDAGSSILISYPLLGRFCVNFSRGVWISNGIAD